MEILKAIECGIGIADMQPGCSLCERKGLACPEHAAPYVLRVLREFGLVERG